MSHVESDSALQSFPVEIAVEQICEQHRHMALVVGSLNASIDAIRAGQLRPDIPRLRAMLRYLDSFGEGVHCAIEHEYVLSPMLLNDASDEVIAHAVEEHSACARLFAALQAGFEEWRHVAPTSDSAFPQIAADYGALQASHLAFEESVLLPHALEQLPADEWPPLVRAFESNPDPLFGESLLPAFLTLEYLRPIAHSLLPVVTAF